MKTEKLNIAVLGDGGWGTALALHLHGLGHRVSVWSAFPENAASVMRDHENKRFLPGVAIPGDMPFSPDMEVLVKQASLILLATPAQFLRGTLTRLKPGLDPERHLLVNVAKGIETASLLRMSELSRGILGGDVRYAALSGPSHAEEVSRGVPTLVVAASEQLKTAKTVQKIFMNERFRVYTSQDVVGVELGGALKNVYAVAAGILDGIGMGDNTKAALMTRAIAELARLGVRLGGKRRTFSGLSGVGDLIVTCMSRHSRNRHVGEELGRGRSLDEVLSAMNMSVAEGVKTCEAAKRLADSVGVETPLVNGVHDVLFRNRPPAEIIRGLMTRKARSE